MILDPDYARIFTQARIVAWNYGYTCAAIGSYTRDLDLLLVPWEPRAIENHDQLLKLIAQSCGLRFRDGVEDILKAKPDWTEKPHGRRSCSLFFTGPYDRRWVDIGIMPCAPQSGHVRYAWTVDGMEPDAKGTWVRGSAVPDGVGVVHGNPSQGKPPIDGGRGSE